MTKNSKQIIFQADDFNLSSGVNRGIIKAHKAGVVKSTSIMINLQGAEESIWLLKKHPNLDVGLHVNLTFGAPVCSRDDVASLVDDEGVFWRNPQLLKNSAEDLHIRKEIFAQFNLAEKMGVDLTHMDSHHHIHALDERVEKVLIEIAMEKGLAIRSLNEEKRDLYRRYEIPTPDNYNGNFHGMEMVTLENLEKIILDLPDGTSEIMCHPGYVDEELTLKSSYNYLRELEVKILSHPMILQTLQKIGAKIIGFKEIVQFFTDYDKMQP